jgi:hypothetical protein
MLTMGRNKEDDLNEVAFSLGINNNIIKDMTAVCTDNYYKEFASTRINQLENSELINILSNKLRLDPEQLLGLLVLFFN